MDFKIALGSKVKDNITGLTGIVTSRTEWLNGCKRYAVQPKINKDGKVPDVEWIDEDQLTVIKTVITEQKNTGGYRPAPKGLSVPKEF